MMRTFISIDIPLTDAIEEVLDEMKRTDNVRLVPKGQMHLTLKFLGDQDERKVEKLCSSLKETLNGTEPFDIVVEGAGAFPDMRHPKVVWLGVKDPESLIGLAEKVDSAVKGMKLKSDDKRFSPHITIGRVNSRAELDDFFSRHKGIEFCSFCCDHVDVMKSVLTPKGAIHSVVERLEL